MKFTSLLSTLMIAISASTAVMVPANAAHVVGTVYDGHHIPSSTGPLPLITVFDEANIDMTGLSHHLLGKRAYYSCYSNSPNTTVAVDDCQHVVDDVRAYNGSINVINGLCLNWIEGSCEASLCARMSSAGTKGQNRTADWVADQLATPLVENCARQGLDGVKSDCKNVIGYCGTFRLWLKHSH